jgi:hypothetical protein
MFFCAILTRHEVFKSKKFYKNNFKDKSIKGENQTIVFMIDGKMPQSGLSDRLCRLVSTYNYCCMIGKEFRVFLFSI